MLARFLRFGSALECERSVSIPSTLVGMESKASASIDSALIRRALDAPARMLDFGDGLNELGKVR